MIPLVAQRRTQIAELCMKYRVKRLELFGSAAAGVVDQDANDLDFFYEFFPDDTRDLADRYFSLLDDLTALFGRNVDLVHERSARNPYFLESARRHKVELYAA